MKLLTKAIVFISLVFATPAFCGDEVQITGIFSDMKYVEEADDLLGMEVIILLAIENYENSYYAVIQFAEGVPAKPRVVPLKVNGNKIEFNVKYLDDKIVKFVGEVKQQELIGRFVSGLNYKIKLPRANSYWQ